MTNQRLRVIQLRALLVIAILAGWEALARSGLLFRDVVPSLVDIGHALISLLADPAYYFHLGWTLMEIVAALGLGAVTGLAAGLLLGANRFLGRAFIPFVYYLGSTPKLVFFPVMILFFGVGPASKIALGVLSCFFPVALSTAAGVREIDRVFVRVGRSFRARPRHMISKIYVPALRQPIINGLRLGLGITVIATLLAETKLSNRGLGHLISQAFTAFDMPQMYALLITAFALAIGANALLSRLARN
jgi:ABC-type nitrate/sulfonate/bicarbonate transport system permease component